MRLPDHLCAELLDAVCDVLESAAPEGITGLPVPAEKLARLNNAMHALTEEYPVPPCVPADEPVDAKPPMSAFGAATFDFAAETMRLQALFAGGNL